MDIFDPASILIYNNSMSFISFVCNLSYNIISFTNLSNNFLSPNNYGIFIFIDFIKKLSLFSEFDIILVIVNQLTKQVIFILVYDIIIFVNLTHLFVFHIFSRHSVPSYVISNRGLKKIIGKPNTQARLSSNISKYTIITSKITGLNFYLLCSLLTTIL